MELKDVFYAIGDFLEWTFGILPPLGNIPNYIYIAIIAFLFLYWTAQLVKHKRAGEH